MNDIECLKKKFEILQEEHRLLKLEIEVLREALMNFLSSKGYTFRENIGAEYGPDDRSVNSTRIRKYYR